MIENIIEFITKIFLKTQLGEMSGIEFIVFVILTVGGFLIVKKILKFIKAALFVIGRITKNLTSAKEKCKRIQCLRCGRTLDKCICDGYRNKLSIVKLLKYKKEHKKK